MASYKGGVVEDSKTYTHAQLADLLGRNDEWVIENVIDQGCRSRKIGMLYFVSGLSFRLWIEIGATQETKKERNRRNGDKRLDRTVGDQAEG